MYHLKATAGLGNHFGRIRMRAMNVSECFSGISFFSGNQATTSRTIRGKSEFPTEIEIADVARAMRDLRLLVNLTALHPNALLLKNPPRADDNVSGAVGKIVAYWPGAIAFLDLLYAHINGDVATATFSLIQTPTVLLQSIFRKAITISKGEMRPKWMGSLKL